METQQLLLAHEVASILDIDRTTVFRRLQAGNLPTVGKLSGSRGPYLFDRAEIEALAAESSDENE